MNDIIVPVVVPTLQRIGNSDVFQDDNARLHRARGVQLVLQQNGIQRMDWPARSQDMNLIEHLWDLLDHQVRNCQQPPQTVAQLRQALVEEWRRIPQAVVTNLIRSMRRRCTEVLNNNGGHTHY